MALSKPSVLPKTKEETNFLRLAHLVIRISPTAVRTLFDNHFNPVGLQIYLNQIKGKLESLCQKRVINQSQLDLLFPTNGPCVTSSDMDVTLMLALIRNFTKLKIKDTLPTSTDVSEGDDLSRIKHYRNVIAHSVDGSINDTEFHSAWKEISEALQRIGGVSFKDKCNALLVAELDNSYRNVYLDFVRTETRLQEIEDDVKQLKLQQNDPVPTNIREHMLDEITTWKSDEAKFFATSAAKSILSMVKKTKFVVITGCPGMGKTATARYIALVLNNTEDFDILPVNHLKHIIKYCKKGCNQIFVLDDMCGKFTADQNIIFEFNRYQNPLLKLFERNPNSLRVIGTSRLQIVKDDNFRRFSECFGITECNLLSEELLLSTNEKRKIASKHFDAEVLQKLDDDTINQFDMFPLLCSMFAKSDDKANFDIFHNPFKELEREFDEIRYKNEDCFVGLALLVIHNNNLNKNIFKESPNQKLCQILDNLFEIFRLAKSPVKHHVEAMLQTLNKTYVTESDTHFKAVHDKIFDMISFYFGKIMIEIILEYGDSTFIMERMELESLNEPNDEFKIMIPPNIEDLYFRRILQEISDRKLHHVLGTSQLKHETYERTLLTYLSQNPNISSVLIHNQWSYVMSEFYGLYMILEYLINQLEAETFSSDKIVLEECLDKTYFDEAVKNGPILSAINKGLYESGRVFLEHGIDSNSVCCVDDDNITLLQFACGLGQTEFVSMLIKYNCDVNLMHKGIAPIHIACKEQYSDIVDSLIKANCDVNIQDEDDKTPFLIACETENINIVTMLLNTNCTVNLSNLDGQTPLHIACSLGFEDGVKRLLSTCCDVDNCSLEKLLTANCDVNTQDKDKKTPLLIACETGNINIVLDLFSSNCDVNLSNAQGQTPLHVSCFLGFEDVVKILLSTRCFSENCDFDTYCDVNIQDNNEKTPFLIACENGNTSIARELLISNCNLNLPNAEGQTPLHVACIKGFEDIVQLLLTHPCDIDERDANGNTALAICCFSGHCSIAKLLIENCCDFNIVDSEGILPLEIAINAGHSDIVNLLISTNEQIFLSRKESDN